MTSLSFVLAFPISVLSLSHWVHIELALTPNCSFLSTSAAGYLESQYHVYEFAVNVDKLLFGSYAVTSTSLALLFWMYVQMFKKFQLLIDHFVSIFFYYGALVLR